MSRISKAIRSIARASRALSIEKAHGTQDVLLFRTHTPWQYQIGGIWEDQRGEPWTITDLRYEEEGRVGIYGPKR